MAATAAMQGEPVALMIVVAVLSVTLMVLVRLALVSLPLGPLLRRLSAGDEGGQSRHLAGLGRAVLQRAGSVLLMRLVLLRVALLMRLVLLMRLMLLMGLVRLVLLMRLLMVAVLKMLRFARQIRLRFARAERSLALLAGSLIIVVVEHVVARAGRQLVFRTIELRIVLPELLLRGGNQAIVMFGMLVIVFGRDRIAGGLRIARELNVFFRDVGRRPANFDIGTIRLINPGHGIVVFAVAPAHALILTVSHDSPVANPFIETAQGRHCFTSASHYQCFPLNYGKQRGSDRVLERETDMRRFYRASDFRLPIA